MYAVLRSGSKTLHCEQACATAGLRLTVAELYIIALALKHIVYVPVVFMYVVCGERVLPGAPEAPAPELHGVGTQQIHGLTLCMPES